MPVVVKSKMTPMTYDDLSKGVISASNAQNELENTYMDMQDKAAQIMAQANQQTDPESYQKLKAYADGISFYADELLKQGLKSGSRQGLLNMKREYSQGIVPIEQAVARRKELSEERRKLALQYPDIIFENSMDDVSLDALVRDPNLTYGKTVNGAQIQKEVAETIARVGSNLGSIRAGGYIDPYTREVINQSGFTIDQIQNAQVSDDTILGQIAQNILQKSGIYDFKNTDAIRRAEDYAKAGFWGGIGEVKRTAMEDFGARQNLQQQQAKERFTWQQNGTTEQGEIIDADGKKWFITGKIHSVTKTPLHARINSDGTITYGIKSKGATDKNPTFIEVKESDVTDKPVSKSTKKDNRVVYYDTEGKMNPDYKLDNETVGDIVTGDISNPPTEEKIGEPLNPEPFEGYNSLNTNAKKRFWSNITKLKNQFDKGLDTKNIIHTSEGAVYVINKPIINTSEESFDPNEY